MTIRFSIDYNTTQGEGLYITGPCTALGGNNISNALKLTYTSPGKWEGEIKVSPAREKVVSYRYFVKGEGGIHYEAGKGRSIALNPSTKEIAAYDQWQGNSADAPFLTAPFAEVFFADESQEHTLTHIHTNELIIRVTVPNVPKGGKVFICGSAPQLGEWEISRALPLKRMANLKWEGSFPVEGMEGREIEFKFLLQTPQGEYIWENRYNRVLQLPKVLRHSTAIKEYSGAGFDAGHPRLSGVSIPVFSLRSASSHGIGDFGDLRKMADWANATGLSIIQLLPINDTTTHLTWRDSYPYNCISTLALHPIYINLEAVGKLEDEALREELEQEGKRLNAGRFLDYEGVWKSKMRYLRAIYLQEKGNVSTRPGYCAFVEGNREWLLPYAAFSALRDRMGTANFRDWGKYSTFSWKMIDTLASAGDSLAEEIHFYIFIQYHLHLQMVQAKEYAHSKGVALKGDIPIGISRNSVEAWQYPHLFNFGQQAGAPPDAFSTDGQNWGFPTYNWEEMEKDNYTWWKNRFSHFATYFDAYRIDHILGFFRIWEIPVEYRSGLMGHFYPALPLSEEELAQWGFEDIVPGELFIEDPYSKGKWHPMIGAPQEGKFAGLYHNYFYERHNDFWYHNAMKKLQQLIASTNMLTCGEDLGMLNESVSRCMNNLKILSLELQIMPKEYGVELGDPLKYPYLSVCTTSTHDCETLRMWLGARKGASDATPQECLETIARNMASPSMLAILPLQDWLSIDGTLRCSDAASERINIPAVADHYWKYRMHLTIEDLLAAEDLNKTIKELSSR